MQARLEASIKAAAAKEAEAAAAAKAEQAALQAAAKARQQSCAAVAAATGAQPHISCPGFGAVPQKQQQPLQLSDPRVRQEFEGQQLLNSMAAAASQPVAGRRRAQENDGRSASRIAFGPSRDCSSTYDSRMREMQDHIDELTKSLSQNRRSSPKRQRGQKAQKQDSKDRHHASQHSKKRRPSHSPAQQGNVLGVLDLFKAEDESAEEAQTSSTCSSDDDISCSDRSAILYHQQCSNSIASPVSAATAAVSAIEAT